MDVINNAEKIILKRKLDAERIADVNVNNVLKDDNIRVLFVKCKRLVVDIAKMEVCGGRADKERKEYNDTREVIAEALKSMGVDKSTLRPNYTCKKCNDVGYINGKKCECLKKVISQLLMESSGIDITNMARFDGNYDAFENKEKVKLIYDKMKKFVDEISLKNSPIDIVLLSGNTGVGKTHLMECMATEAIDNGLSVKYTTAFNFNQDMLKYHCSRVEEKSNFITPYLDSDIVFIDDLGTENKIDNVTNEYLYLIVNERMTNHKKLVISTNLDLKQLQDVYGERIFSRLMHKKCSVKINFEGKDLRLKTNKKTS